MYMYTYLAESNITHLSKAMFTCYYTSLSSLCMQLVHECRDTLKEAIEVRKKYREVMEVVTRNDHSREQVDADLEFFESDLNKVLMVRRGLNTTAVV